MNIIAENLGKRYEREWIFRDFTLSFSIGKATALIGNNGSGKSTLLKTLAGVQLPSAGKLSYSKEGKEISAEVIFHELSIVAPYTDLIEELSLEEALRFHQRFKPLICSEEEFYESLAFAKAKQKLIKHFSSGMKQKLKLALAFYAKGTLLFLDEPSSNLDSQNTQWYLEQFYRAAEIKTIVLASNLSHEFSACTQHVYLENYKTKQQKLGV